MNIITGYRGEPHITSSQDRAKNQGTFGTGSYILDVGQKLNAEIISANEIRIRDGVLSHQGCVANIEQGAYDSLEISNGSQGMQRRDLIVARYTKDAETNIEDISLVVIEGTPAASSPVDPSYNTGNIQSGDSPVDMPLYRVNINGTTISSTTRLASTVRTQAETDTLLGNTSISGIGNGTVTGALSTLNSKIAIGEAYPVNTGFITVNFENPFPSMPTVIVTLVSNSTALAVPKITNISRSGFSVAVIGTNNNYLNSHITWAAVI
jgi:hypothetical protein